MDIDREQGVRLWMGTYSKDTTYSREMGSALLADSCFKQARVTETTSRGKEGIGLRSPDQIQ